MTLQNMLEEHEKSCNYQEWSNHVWREMGNHGHLWHEVKILDKNTGESDA